jgi:hypothetical protein
VPGFVNYKKGYTRLTAASDKDYQLLAHGRWFSPDTLASSTTKTGLHDIAEILLKVVLKTKHPSINQSFLNSSDRRGQIFGRSDRSLILGGPIVRQTFCCCFVCNGFVKHVPWLLISCLNRLLMQPWFKT